jgi:hypothetical protein
VGGELLWREGKFPFRRSVFIAGLVVVVGIDDELPFDWHGAVLAIVEIDPPAKSARR